MSLFRSMNESESSQNESESGTESHESADDITEEGDSNISSDEDLQKTDTNFTPYAEEPLAPAGYEEEINDGSDDPDDIRPDVLADREQGVIPVEIWCKCKHCKTENLNGAMEHRCCMEALNFQGKLVFDGSIGTLNCITEHEDYKAITNKAVLEYVAPLLMIKTVQKKFKTIIERFLRAVAYRWTIRWFCGFMGWDNTRPLSSCIYEEIRMRFHSRHITPRGYRS